VGAAILSPNFDWTYPDPHKTLFSLCLQTSYYPNCFYSHCESLGNPPDSLCLAGSNVASVAEDVREQLGGRRSLYPKRAPKSIILDDDDHQSASKQCLVRCWQDIEALFDDPFQFYKWYWAGSKKTWMSKECLTCLTFRYESMSNASVIDLVYGFMYSCEGGGVSESKKFRFFGGTGSIPNALLIWTKLDSVYALLRSIFFIRFEVGLWNSSIFHEDFEIECRTLEFAMY